MLPVRSTLFLLCVLVPAIAAAQPPDGAFGDPDARRIVENARSYREQLNRSLRRYTTTVAERVSVGLTMLRRDRLLYRRELVADVTWNRNDISIVHVDAAREAIPIVFRDARVIDDADELRDLVFDPTEDRLFVADGDSSFVYHPFGPDGERHYRYRSGDTTEIRLPDGHTIRLLALEVRPAVRDVRSLTGTVWVDAESWGMVRAVFRLADALELGLNVEEEDDDDIPGFLRPIRADVNYITLEYGLWELRWWLPRIVAFEATAQVGSLLRVPVTYERRYGAYTVEGDPEWAGAPALPDTAGLRQTCSAIGPACRCHGRDCRRPLQVEFPVDTLDLLTSEWLPASIFREGEVLLSEADLTELTNRLDNAVPEPPWQVVPPRVEWGLSGAGLVRFNRIEGLSLGARVHEDFGRLQAGATARLGLADLEPDAEIRIERTHGDMRLGLAAYRGLAAMNPATRPLAFGNSFNSLFLGRDDGEYFRTAGVELTGAPAPALGSDGYAWRIFLEHHRTAHVETDFSLRHVLDDAHVFRINRPADRADLVGAELVLRYERGLDPDGLRWGADLALLGATGTFDFARTALTLRATTTISRAAVSLEVASGTSTGDVPVQHLWFLGGAATIRGYAGATEAGEAFWRARTEIATAMPAARIALFADAGQAAARRELGTRPSMLSVGAGASFLDGILRIDLARALRGATGWRLELYVDGLL
jgi:hypothetical protein